MGISYVWRIKKVLNKSVAADIEKKEHSGFVHHKTRRVPCGYEIAFVMPPGAEQRKVKRSLDAVSVAVGTIVELEFDPEYTNVCIFRIVEKDFPKEILLQECLKDLRKDCLLLGYTRNGDKVYHPFDRSLLDAGASGGGKTELIRLCTFQMILQGYIVYIIDLKEFSFFPFLRLPNLHVSTTLEQAKETLEDVKKEMDRRVNLIKKYHDRGLTKEFQKIAVIIDEAAELSPSEQVDGDDKETAKACDKMLSHIARLGREVKTVLMYSTQRPSKEIINAQVKSNIETKIAFRTSTAANSLIILDRTGAEQIRPEHKGRCIYSGPGGDMILQVPYVGDDEQWIKLLARMIPDERASRKDIESAQLRSLGISAAIGNAQQFTGPLQESLPRVQGIGAKWPPRVDVSRPKETVDAKQEREEDEKLLFGNP